MTEPTVSPSPAAPANRPSLAVLYGQTDAISTSFQTSELVRHLEPWLDPLHLRVGAAIPSVQLGGRLRTQAKRVLHNLFVPWLRRPRTDYVLYANDGVADLKRWPCRSLVYWYDAPADWSREPPAPRDWIQHRRYRNVIQADWVFAVSHIQVELARALRPGREAGVVYLPVGVDCDRFVPGADPAPARRRYALPDDRPIIGYLGYVGMVDGRFSGEPLADAAAAVLAERPAHFFIVGRGPGLDAFKARVESHGVARHFTFAGFVPDELLVSSLAAMDIAVDTLEPGFHSLARSETKLKQYMAMGLACVATALGENVVDLEEGACGRLVEPGPGPMAQALGELADDAEARERLGRGARRRAEAVYAWPRLAERLIEALGLPARPRS